MVCHFEGAENSSFPFPSVVWKQSLLHSAGCLGKKKKRQPMWEKYRAEYFRPASSHPNFWPKPRDTQDRFFFAVGNLSVVCQETVASPEEEPAI